MEFTARRTGRRRYAVIARPERRPAVTMDPAPGFDARLPHDLVHYVVERELGIVAVCTRLDELSARWSTLGIGGTLTVDWPETATSGTLHAAGGSGRRAANRPRRGQTPRRA